MALRTATFLTLLALDGCSSFRAQLPGRRRALAMMAATAPPVTEDWGGLPGAVKASRCGALNNQMVKAEKYSTILQLVDENDKLLNGVNVATALHQIARLTKFKRAERDGALRDPRFQVLMDGTIERVSECSARAVADILWSCATLSNFPPLLLKPVLTQVQPAANPAPAPLSNARAPLATAGGQVP